jgi:hypothetical protein
MAKQRVFIGNARYKVIGPAKLERTLLFLNKFKLNGKEILLFRAVRKIKKQRP